MSLAGLISALEQDAEARIAAELELARAEAAAVGDESARRLAALRERATGDTRARLEQHRHRELAIARRDARGSVMASRAKAIGRVRERLHALALAPEEAAAPAVLERLAMAALGYVEGEPAVVRGAPALLEQLRPHLPDGAAVRLAGDTAVPAGAVVATEDGRVTVDATLAGWIAAREAEVRLLIARALEETDDGAV